MCSFVLFILLFSDIAKWKGLAMSANPVHTLIPSLMVSKLPCNRFPLKLRGSISLNSAQTFNFKSKIPSDLSQKDKKLKIAREMSMSTIQKLILLITSEISKLTSVLSLNLWLPQNAVLDQVYSY